MAEQDQKKAGEEAKPAPETEGSKQEQQHSDTKEQTPEEDSNVPAGTETGEDKASDKPVEKSADTEQNAPAGDAETTGKEKEEAAPEQNGQEDDDKGDPHRGTSETLSQHKDLDPDAARNNDMESYEGTDTSGKEATTPAEDDPS